MDGWLYVVCIIIYLNLLQAAAMLGNKFAQSQVVKLNPYAKLCNQMLTEAIEKLQDGYQK